MSKMIKTYFNAGGEVIEQYRNVYIDLSGHIRPLPFNGGYGIWRFDGQFYFKEKTYERP